MINHFLIFLLIMNKNFHKSQNIEENKNIKESENGIGAGEDTYAGALRAPCKGSQAFVSAFVFVVIFVLVYSTSANLLNILA